LSPEGAKVFSGPLSPLVGAKAFVEIIARDVRLWLFVSLFRFTFSQLKDQL
jgi:hypothetical protein